MSDSEDSFGWVPIKREIKLSDSDTAKKSKKKPLLNGHSINHNDTTTAISHQPNQSKKEKKKKINSNIDISAKNDLLNSDFETNAQITPSKKSKKKAKESKAAEEAMNSLLQSDSDSEQLPKKKKKKSKKDVEAKKLLLQADDEDEPKNKRKKGVEEISSLPEITITKVKTEKIVETPAPVQNSFEEFLMGDFYKRESVQNPSTKKTRKADSKLDDFKLAVKITLKDYLSGNNHLVSETVEDGEVMLGPDDDIWVLTCPNSLSIQHLQNLKVAPNSKTKLRLGDITYECVMKNNDSLDNTVNLILHDNLTKECHIKTQVINGTVNISEKIPKEDTINEELIIEEDVKVEFPPLKTRHPFFGPDYEKHLELDPKVLKKIKKARQGKTHKNIKIEAMKEEPQSPKKRKKRKRDSENETFSSKKIKKEVDEIEIDENWESAYGIERKLFYVKEESK